MPFFQVVVSGLIATGLMIVFMEAIYRVHWAATNMVEAIGTAVTGSTDHSFGVGLVFDLFLGCVFSLIYYAILKAVPISDPASDIRLLIALGVAQGLVAAMALVILTDASETFAKFRKGTTGIILGYLSGHFVYGLSLGILFFLFHILPYTSYGSGT